MSFVFLLYVSLLAPGVAASAQQPADVAMIEAATARYVKAHFVKGVVAIDTTNAYLHSSGAPVSARSHAELKQLSQILGAAKLGGLSDFRICSTPGNANACELRGADAVVSMARPVVNGDTAVVLVRIFSAYRSSNGQAFTGSRSERIQVIRRDTQWVATKILPGGSIS